MLAGAPICPPGRLAEKRLITVGAAHGLRARLFLSAQPVWNPHGRPAIRAHKASLRAQLARARHKDVTITSLAPDLAAQAPALRGCLVE